MKKLNNNQKEKIVFIVTALIIVSILIAVICNLSIVKASADDITMVVNGSQELIFEPIEDTVVVDGYEVGTLSKCTQVEYTGYEVGNATPIRFAMTNLIITDAYIYVPVIMNFVVTAPADNFYYLSFNTSYNGNSYGTTTRCYITTDYTVISFYVNPMVSRTYDYITVSAASELDIVACYVGYDALLIAENSVSRCEYENEILNPPANVVYGTDQIVKTLYNTHTNYQPQDLLIPWNNFYLGFICSAVIEGTTVDLLYSVAYENYQYGHGTIVILDDAYHDYILEVDLEGAVTYGQIKLDIENNGNEFDVKYMAVSDNYTLLSEDLVAKVNEYNQIGDSESYNAGYADGYAAGIKQGSIGPFANAKMMVEFSIRELASNIVTESVMEFPFDVNAGGISFENVWYWYNNSRFNDPDYAVQAVNISIYLTKPLLWKNTLFYFGNESNSDTFLPLYVSVRNTGTSGNNLYTASLDQIGDYFYVTLDNVEYLSIESIEFTVTNANTSYADIFVTNKLTLYSDINQVIVDEMSYNLGEQAGYKNGYDNGFFQGELQAQTVAFSEGRDAGFADGRQVGYNEGYEQGLQDDFRFYDLFFSLFDAQLNTFKSVVSFEIFGINVAGFVLGLVTICIVAFVIRKVW